MAQGINIGIAADTREFDRGIQRGVIEPLEDAADTLEKLGKADDLGRLEGDLKDAQRATERLDSEIKTLDDSIRRTGRSGRGMGDDLRDGTRRAEDGMENLKDESKETAREAAASFDGSAESIADAFQEVAANAFIGFGPAGLAAGLAIAAGLGMAISAGQDMADALNDAKERTHELAQELYEVGGEIDRVDLGGKMRQWALEISDSVEWFEFWQKEAVSNLDRAEEAAKRTGSSLEDMLGAMSGYDAEAAVSVLEDIDQKIEEINERIEDSPVGATSDERLIALSKERDYYEKLREEVVKNTGATDDAIRVNELLTEATEEHTAAAEAAAEAERARAAAMEALQAPIDDAVGAYDDFKNAETGALDPAAYISGIEQRIAATSNFNANVASISEQFGLTQAESQAILDQGLSFAPMLQAIMDSGMAPQFVAQIQAAVGGGQDILDGTPLSATVDADVQRAEDIIAEVTGKPRKAEDVRVNAETKAAERDIDRVANQRRTAVIVADAHTGSAERQLNYLANVRRVAYIDVETRGGGGRFGIP